MTEQEEILSILSPVLGEEVARAILDHRKAKKAKLTVYAAKLQVKEYIKTGNPIAAAEMQIFHNWVAIKADWYFNQIAKDKKTAETVRPTFKTSADRFQSREDFIRASIERNRRDLDEPVNENMRDRLKAAGIC